MATDGDNAPQRPPSRGFGPMGQPPDAGFGCIWVLIIAIIIIILIWIFGWGWGRGTGPGGPTGPEGPGQGNEPNRPNEPNGPGPSHSFEMRALPLHLRIASVDIEGREHGGVIARAELTEGDT